MEYKYLLFDFDGTLCDSHNRSLEIINILAEEFKFKQITHDQLRSFREKPLREVLKLMSVPFFKIPAIIRRAKTQFSEQIDALHPVIGMTEALAELKKMGFQLGIVTSNSKENVQKFLSRNKISDFEVIVGDSSLFGKAPILKRLLRDLKVNAAETIYIGDETRDVEAAKSAKMKAIAVTWGYNSKEVLERCKPDHIIESPLELVTLLKTFPEQ